MAKSQSVDPPAIEPSFFEEVGRLCAAWAFLERAIELEIWQLLRAREDVGSCITANLDFKRRWDLLIDLAQKVGKSEQHAFYASQRKNATNLTRDRNLIVHGRIVWNFEHEYRRWAISRGAYSKTINPVSENFVVKTRRGVQALAHAIDKKRFIKLKGASLSQIVKTIEKGQ